jgi:hypothetical protein
MTGHEPKVSTAGPGRFVLTLGWSGQHGDEEARVELDVLDAARLRDALSLGLAEIEEAALRTAVAAWHAARARSRGHDRDDELDGDAA